MTHSPLTYRSNNTFKIAQFTDIHIGYPNGEADLKTLADFETCLAHLDVDLIVITGDLVWAYGGLNPLLAFKQLIKRLNKVDIPVAITYGNHDSEYKITRSDLRQLETTLTHSVTKENSSLCQDRENYTLSIYDKVGDKILHQLFLIDSGNEAPKEVGGYAYLFPEQINWFKQKELATKHSLLNLIFMHIPLVEYQYVKEKITSGGQLEAICCPKINTGLFSSLVLSPHNYQVFCGHDHDNNFTASLNQVGLNYGLISGYNVYGVFNRGYREITLHHDQLTTRLVPYQKNPFS
ncbi:metallophosphoesterase family protein [Vagococcus humatus]|uniref:Calcineurin-like phosphoesterase domain-containing protein n=1 Tax=Vagococcus humatus TaxID=1889241 RepID=A0A429Z8U5_9ENTE|nr:metallophosphoesterase family protein [Vagococcus humatus]RST90065.1 hypothetical protein C7P63_03020 [Vagococcus humatus]